MCGIAGILRRRGGRPGDRERIVAMTDRLVHRGPDDHGYLWMDVASGRHALGQSVDQAPESCDLALGSRRLAILDLTEHGRMPMANSRGDLFITYNGEVYNYVELRDQLRGLGHVFATGTDTEVVLHAYAEWGADCVTRFNGMWAFALWDQRRRTLFCSRDRFGIKPFYYLLSDHAFIFASEVKAILPAMDGPPRPNDEVLHQFLVDRKDCHTTETLYADVRRLPPAHNLTIQPLGARLQRYWDYDTVGHDYELSDPAGTLRELLDDATALRLRSDVPTGLALSGGLDSTSVLSCMRKHRPNERFQAFTAVFPGDPADETAYTRLAARHFDVELHCVEYDDSRFVEDLSEAIWFMDFPSINYQPLPNLRVMREARRHVTVMLEGQGSDEILAGYQERYFLPQVMDELSRAFRTGDARAALGAWQTCRAIHERYGRTPFLHGMARTFEPLEMFRRRRKMGRRGIATDFVRAFGGPKHDPLPRLTGDRLNDAMRDEHARTYLPWILHRGDAISMAASVESRMPFMDHRVVEFAFQVGSEHKMRDGVTKLMLRRAMGDRLPAKILERRDKIGFLAPAAKWIADTLDTQIRPVLTSRRFRERGYFDAQVIEGLLQRDRLGDFYASDAIYQALSVELWMRTFIDQSGS